MNSIERKTPLDGRMASFLRQRDYRIIRELGEGATGKTVLLEDDEIDEMFVCKKYRPFSEEHRAELFENFVREIKLLHKLHHKNVVRVFNYYLYRNTATGFILMEYVNGLEIDEYIKQSPERLNDCFVQAISGFAYLESCGILHRDIRMQNLMVNNEGTLKIIDLGFGKKITGADDFKKSITLNWHCSPPAEFEQSRYDFSSEVYFVGKLFQRLASDSSATDFKFTNLVASMCAFQAQNRPENFQSIETEIQSGRFADVDFDEWDLQAYRRFATAVFQAFTKIEKNSKYLHDTDRLLQRLMDGHRRVSMEEVVPDVSNVLGCFVEGAFYFNKNRSIRVYELKDFVELLRRSSPAQRRVILANLHSKLDAVERYATPAVPHDDFPF